MITRRQFFRKECLEIGQAATRVVTAFQEGDSGETQHDNRYPAFTELSPSLLAMESERTGIAEEKDADSEELRRSLYEQLADSSRRPDNQ
ncbi:MAG: hypothetical protein AVO39_02390 [delta proteobacterium MLS_D]|jgi:hypothetical protein|nr:MAG: hypothetical protein AVO39_02390 [delta proteobacterium MLS_D]